MKCHKTLTHAENLLLGLFSYVWISLFQFIPNNNNTRFVPAQRQQQTPSQKRGTAAVLSTLFIIFCKQALFTSHHTVGLPHLPNYRRALKALANGGNS